MKNLQTGSFNQNKPLKPWPAQSKYSLLFSVFHQEEYVKTLLYRNDEDGK